jgi:hypothetical protein
MQQYPIVDIGIPMMPNEGVRAITLLLLIQLIDLSRSCDFVTFPLHQGATSHRHPSTLLALNETMKAMPTASREMDSFIIHWTDFIAPRMS